MQPNTPVFDMSFSATMAASSTDHRPLFTVCVDDADDADELVAGDPPRICIVKGEIFEVEARFEVQSLIGKGAYGCVGAALDTQTNKSVAIKKIKQVFNNWSTAKRILREIKLLRLFRHENIVSLKRVMRPPTREIKDLYIVMECMETDLHYVLRSKQPLSAEHFQCFLYQILSALKYIHSANCVHRDIKPQNLLLNSNCDLKIGDFGLARVLNPARSSSTCFSGYVATLWYRAPELFMGAPYGKASDMWSVGCTFAEMFLRKPMFPGKTKDDQLLMIIRKLGVIHKRQPDPDVVDFRKLFPTASDSALDLLRRLLSFDSSMRITAEEALVHPYFDDYRRSKKTSICPPLPRNEFAFDDERLDRRAIHKLMLREITQHYEPNRPPTPSTELKKTWAEIVATSMLLPVPP